MNKVLDADRPDLVVLNGDLITGENTYLFNGTDLVDKLVLPMLDRQLPWASTYGNHDHQVNITGATILAREKKWPNAMTRQMVHDTNAGISNYFLPVYPNNCTVEHSCAPDLLLWFFDSRGGFRYQETNDDGSPVGQPNWVDDSVVNWFRQTNALLVNKHQKTIPSVGFVHIPTNASWALQTQSKTHLNYQPGIDDDYPLASQSQGWCPNGVDDGTCDYGGQDVPFMHAVSTTPGFLALFSGHDHGDTWCYKWNGIIPGMTIDGNGLNLCFGQHTGYGGYGNWIRGARQLRMTKGMLEKGEVESWIRLEGGDVVGKIMLNATYGEDWYPTVPNTQTGCDTCNYTVITPMPGTKKRPTRRQHRLL